jgi:hypothetical protein
MDWLVTIFIALLPKLAEHFPEIFAAVTGGTSLAETLARVRSTGHPVGAATEMVQGIFAAERKARADAAAAANPRVSGHHVDVLKRLAVSDSLTREERHALTESAAFVSTTLALDDVQALSAPGGTWPSRDAGIPAKFLREMGTADTVPAPSASVPEMQRRLASLKEEAARHTDAVRVEYLQAEIDVIESALKRAGAWGEPGEGD